MDKEYISTPMLLGKWLYVTTLVDGTPSEVVFNTDKVIMVAPHIDGSCMLTIDCGGGRFSEVNLEHGFEEIVGLL